MVSICCKVFLNITTKWWGVQVCILGEQMAICHLFDSEHGCEIFTSFGACLFGDRMVHWRKDLEGSFRVFS